MVVEQRSVDSIDIIHCSSSRALDIVHLLRDQGIKFEWWYNPPSWTYDGEGCTPSSVQIKFADPAHATFYALKFQNDF